MQKSPIHYPVSQPLLAGKEKQYVNDAIDAGWISSSGEYIPRFEKAVSSFLQLDEGIAVCNGTVALHLACMGLDLKPGMEVIVPSLTYVASANAIAYCGAQPVFADSDLNSWNVTRESIENAWTPKTAGVILVHLYGLPAPTLEIADLCRSRNAWLIEDCAEAFGASIQGHNVGSIGDAATFSFYGNKIISTGEGGMVFMKDVQRRKGVKMLKGQGMDLNRRYWHPIIGYNYRMTNVCAAIGLGQVEMASYHLSERRRIAMRYLKNLKSFANEGLIRLPIEPTGYHNVYWLFSIVLGSGGTHIREEVQNMLLSKYGIETRPFFIPMHKLPMYAGDFKFPNAEFLGDHGINLPTYSGLTDESIDEICLSLEKTIREVFRK
ncbi:MAG: DegT/DnrJ/EryC1/StrS family aminotransferase [Ignavibacteriales bacterium]|nr:DegT/DnrJ/EryC1/StrS family aminotransferase [Ignavibacteriales bacterium]